MRSCNTTLLRWDYARMKLLLRRSRRTHGHRDQDIDEQYDLTIRNYDA